MRKLAMSFTSLMLLCTTISYADCERDRQQMLAQISVYKSIRTIDNYQLQDVRDARFVNAYQCTAMVTHAGAVASAFWYVDNWGDTITCPSCNQPHWPRNPHG